MFKWNTMFEKNYEPVCLGNGFSLQRKLYHVFNTTKLQYKYLFVKNLLVQFNTRVSELNIQSINKINNELFLDLKFQNGSYGFHDF